MASYREDFQRRDEDLELKMLVHELLGVPPSPETAERPR